MRHALFLLVLALASYTTSSTDADVTDADVTEFRQISETYQQLYMEGGENCDRILPVLAEDIRMVENGEEWSHEDMEEYCPHLPRKDVVSS